MSASHSGFQLAKALDAAADAIKARLYRDWDSLSPVQRKALEDAFWDTMGNAMRIRTASVDALLIEARTSLEAVEDVTRRAAALMATLDDIRKAIKVATALFGLAASVAAAVAAPNPAAVVGALKALKKVVDAAEA
ncbi:hypothetical protein [Falsiroseomonas stagni]|uniref:Uncharacterized protein n=1 Tax=Falsiroseomonas stagni DSM 19981 TaxID=1123062 RepID=A0A1I3Y685_9PROT|nr:hypothetical protein [Falsiroseomonas stagni]SFK27273.1 hypothetical protein SAMN02745775_1011003 [Falsiroseomonas stagni DSM 19981]